MKKGYAVRYLKLFLVGGTTGDFKFLFSCLYHTPHLFLWWLYISFMFRTLKKILFCLSGVAQWIDGGPVNQRIASSIPSQGTCLGGGARSPVGSMGEATTHWCFSPSLSPSLPLSLKINKVFKKYIKTLTHWGQEEFTSDWKTSSIRKLINKIIISID